MAFRIPTDFPKSDGTIAWNETPIVVVRLAVSSCEGLGYSYPDAAAAHLIRTKLGEAAIGMNPVDHSRSVGLYFWVPFLSSSVVHGYRIVIEVALSWYWDEAETSPNAVSRQYAQTRALALTR